METFTKWLENQNKSSFAEVGPYKIEIQDNGNGSLLLTVSNKENSYAIDSKGMVRKIIDVSSLQTAPFARGKIALTDPVMKAPMMDRMEPMDNRGAGGLPSP